MFSGIGGFELGIQQAYEAKNSGVVSQRGQVDSVPGRQKAKHGAGMGDTSTRLSDNGTNESSPICVGYSEIDKYAIQIYEKHFNHQNYGDCTTINASELPDFDLLVGGFPCQAFSIAGKRGGLSDTRGTLFYDIARIAKEKRPQHLLLENVKGLLSHDNGRTFKLIISTFAELGYNLEWQVLNSKNFGVPQNRERVFIIGHLGTCCGRQVFPLEHSDEPSNDKDKEETRKRAGEIDQIKGGSQGERIYGTGGVSVTIASQAGGLGAKTGLYMVDDPSRKTGLVDKNIAPTLRTETHGNLPSVLKDARIRRLTPTECERLQGFPDGWTEGVSDTQRYKCLGNAVTVNVIKEIIRSYERTKQMSPLRR